MFQAQLLNTGSTVYSPWMPRGGDLCLATIDNVDSGGTSPTITVTPFTKAKDATGDGTAATGSISSNSTGRTTSEFSALEDLVRFKFAVTGTNAWILFRMLDTVWFDEVDAS